MEPKTLVIILSIVLIIPLLLIPFYGGLFISGLYGTLAEILIALTLFYFIIKFIIRIFFRKNK